ncbi:FadR/GntR family transcriptional regulator [Dactylosporangium aurantiacum]|uniref:FadR/GntR family transcriptional regulator n=1 Tax=Dactylosporangium aurantiacum TaxID=35754 RepID=UPI001FE14319|nr:GntR family transcriptional regulator [Dactylosporangium aurantiacum]MDG6102221.1 GntR family transcriptional regulator [Dactylosporangium aurantiacum]
MSDHVFAQVRDAILSGAYLPDASLPSERELAATFEVNRHAVREALRRLQQLGLVKVSQGGATRVLDWRLHAGLDLAMSTAISAGDALPVGTLVRDMMEMRACIGADSARLCALRGTAAAKEQIAARVDDLAAAAPDLDRMGEANVALWRAVVTGSGNTAYLLAFNSLVSGALAVGHVPPRLRTAELLDVAGHRLLSDHIAGGAGDLAEAQARALLTASLPAPLSARTGSSAARKDSSTTRS